MPECKEKSAARLDTLRAFLTRQAGIFYQKHRRKADCQHALAAHQPPDAAAFAQIGRQPAFVHRLGGFPHGFEHARLRAVFGLFAHVVAAAALHVHRYRNIG